MFLTEVRIACESLIQNRLVTCSNANAEQLYVTPRGGRNRNTKVHDFAGAAYHVKQPLIRSDQSTRLLLREIDLYSLAQGNSIAALSRLLPRLVHVDREQLFLVIEDLPGARTLWECFLLTGGPSGSIRLIRSLGEALAKVHLALQCAPRAWQTSLLRELPWVFNIHKPEPGLLSVLSPANLRLIHALQSEPKLAEQLDHLGDQWQLNTPIHSDLKSDNILVLPTNPDLASDGVQIRIIDWELLQFGDAAWDIAGVLQDLVFFWINSMSSPTAADIKALVSSAQYPWTDVQAAMSSFWEGYKNAAGIDGSAGNHLLLRAVSFSAVRMIQSAYELAFTLPALPFESILLLQLAANVLTNTEMALAIFYGIRLSSPSKP